MLVCFQIITATAGVPALNHNEITGNILIRLKGFLHRDRLAKIIDQWVLPHPNESLSVKELKRIVNFNAYAGWLILDAFAKSLFAAIHGQPVHWFAPKTKGELKDFLVGNPARITPRIQEMIAHYRQHAEDFYRETPFNGRVYHQIGEAAHYMGSARVKRFRRIAEKTSRYLINFISQEVKARADALASERAEHLGIPVFQPITPIGEQREELFQAEQRVGNAIRLGQFPDTLPIFPINDILGVKAVVEECEIERVIGQIDQGRDTSISERETHRGNYNATNLFVRYRWPKKTMLRQPPLANSQEILVKRGLSGDIGMAYRDFISDAEDEVLIEVILTSYEDMLESEIGRSMHEERILSQRQNQQYHGFLARNVEYLMEYLFRFALSPMNELDKVPIKFWARYMPDYIDQLYQQLAGGSPEEDFGQACFQVGGD